MATTPQRLIYPAIAAAALFTTAILFAGDVPGLNLPPNPPSATQPTSQPTSAVDLRNTICPVSGDKVGTSDLVEVYAGKVYHLCCPDCHTDFEKDPNKYASAVAADPAKFGIK